MIWGLSLVVDVYCCALSHIGAGAVLAGVIEPASAEPVRIIDNNAVGANAVVIEGGSRVETDPVVAAGAYRYQMFLKMWSWRIVPQLASSKEEIDEKTQQKQRWKTPCVIYKI